MHVWVFGYTLVCVFVFFLNSFSAQQYFRLLSVEHWLTLWCWHIHISYLTFWYFYFENCKKKDTVLSATTVTGLQPTREICLALPVGFFNILKNDAKNMYVL